MDNAESDEVWDYIVIGGGLTGLGMAALLSFEGSRVLLVEKESEVGGRSRTTQKKGFILDEKPYHLLKFGWKNPLNDVLRAMKHENYRRIMIHPIRHYHLYLGKEETKKLKPNLYEQSKLKYFKQGWISVPRNINQMRKSDYFGVWKLIRIFTSGFKCTYEDMCDKSLQEFNESKKMNETSAHYLKLAAGALMYCPYPDLVSAGEVLRAIKWSSKQPVLFGYPEGGWQTIIDRFVEVIQRNGKILLECESKQILFEENDENRIEGRVLITDKGKYQARNFVLALPPKRIPRLFEQENENLLDPEIRNFIDKLLPISGISMDIAVSNRPYKGRSLLYIENPDAYGIFLSNVEDSVAPPGKLLFTVFSPVHPDNIKDSDFLDKRITELKDRIYSMYPKLKENLEFERVKVHELVDNTFISTTQYKDIRPKTQIPGIDNCFLIGDYVSAYGWGEDIGFNSIWEAYRVLKERK
ncbi:MAG: NAD(P)/FAD-dependent oxidoreductase [Candidatus Lokiarchaeota archaeon]|nr:NAD(P)/FAD-dependent oxidoreductase [Candidatus Lokiarchaeota archaeon]